MRAYRADLAYIHHVGFTDFVRQAAPGLLSLLAAHGIETGHIVDLGCGSGVWARELTRAGYDVTGVDISPDMISLARKQAPRARFTVGPVQRVPIPHCNAITAIGECFNYCFAGESTLETLVALLRRAFRSLHPGGILVFDCAGPGRAPAAGARPFAADGKDWAIQGTVEAGPDSTLVRTMTCFRKVGSAYRRSTEAHRQRLFSRDEVLAAMRSAGFQARAARAYGDFRLAPGLSAFIGAKAR